MSEDYFDIAYANGRRCLTCCRDDLTIGCRYVWSQEFCADLRKLSLAVMNVRCADPRVFGISEHWRRVLEPSRMGCDWFLKSMSDDRCGELGSKAHIRAIWRVKSVHLARQHAAGLTEEEL